MHGNEYDLLVKVSMRQVFFIVVFNKKMASLTLGETKIVKINIKASYWWLVIFKEL